MSRTLTTKSARIEQDSTLDLLSSGKLETKTIRRIPLSLRPDERVMMGAAMGERYSTAIVAAWAPSHKVTSLSASDFDAAVERTHTDFHGLSSDINDESATEADGE